jgi:enoyl-CoA hydratase/carnithine racemase
MPTVRDDFAHVLVTLADTGVGTIELNRPVRLNALDSGLIEDTIGALERLGAGTDCRVVA